jgi:hypothetical protein
LTSANDEKMEKVDFLIRLAEVLSQAGMPAGG